MLKEIKDYIETTKSSGMTSRLKSRSEYWQEIEEYCQHMDCYNGSEKIYLYINQISKPFCACGSGEHPSFISFTEGYREFCSSTCSAARIAQTERRCDTMDKNGGIGLANPNTKKKQQESLQAKHGPDITNPGQIDINRERMKKDNPMFADEQQERMRTDNPMWKPGAKEKRDATNERLHGDKNPARTKVVIDKGKTTKRHNFYKNIDKRVEGKVIPLFTLEEYKGVSERKKYEWECVFCGDRFFDTLDDGHIPRCYKCFPIYPDGRSEPEREIVAFLRELGIKDVQTGNRTIIAPLELDIYLPEYDLAIEHCGLHYHSELGPNERGSGYHLKKMKECHKKGIRLITIFGDEWNNKKEICKNRIRSALNKIEDRIYARNTEARNLSYSEIVSFITENHIQGIIPSSINYGLFYEDELVSVMTFGKPRYGKDRKNFDYEIYRYVSSKSIIGGASKLFKAFTREYNNVKVITFVDRRWGTGKVYERIGFELVSESRAHPWYFNRKIVRTRISRNNFTKPTLKEKYDFDETLTQWEIAQGLGYDRIWDCGNLKFVWDK